MCLRYSQKYIIQLFENVLNSKSQVTLKKAENLLLQIAKCDNFDTEMITLSMKPILKQQLKLFILSLLKSKSRQQMTIVDSNIVQNIFEAIKSPFCSIKYKNYLLFILPQVYQYTSLIKAISYIIIRRIKNGQIFDNSIELIMATKMVLYHNCSCQQQLCFIDQIFSSLKKIGYLLIQNGPKNYQLLEEYLSLIKTISIKWRYLSEQQIMFKYDQQLTQLLITLLRMQNAYESAIFFRIKLKTIEIIQQIVQQFLQTVQQANLPKNSIFYRMDEVFIQLLSLIKIAVQKMQNIGGEFIAKGFSIIINTLKTTIFWPIISNFNKQIIQTAIQALRFNQKQQYAYLHNPGQFILILERIFKPSTNQINEQYIWEQIVSLTLQLLCRNQQKATIQLLSQIFQMLSVQITIQQLQLQKCLILLGILKQEISKRPLILQEVLKIILQRVKFKPEMIEQACAQDINHQITTNINFSTSLCLIQIYFQQLTDSQQVQQDLFNQLVGLLHSNYISDCSSIMALKIIINYIHKYKYASGVLNTLNICLSSRKSNNFLHQVMIIYQQCLQQHFHLIRQINCQDLVTSGINSIIGKIKIWIKNKLYYLVNCSITIICKYYQIYDYLINTQAQMHKQIFSFISSNIFSWAKVDRDIIILIIKVIIAQINSQNQVHSFQSLLIFEEILCYHPQISAIVQLQIIMSELQSKSHFYLMNGTSNIVYLHLILTQSYIWVLLYKNQRCIQQNNYKLIQEILNSFQTIIKSIRNIQFTTILLCRILRSIEIKYNLNNSINIYKFIIRLLQAQLNFIDSNKNLQIEESNIHHQYFKLLTKRGKFEIDQWQQFKQLIQFLRNEKTMSLLEDSISKDQTILIKKFMHCQTFQNQTRLFFQIKKLV